MNRALRAFLVLGVAAVLAAGCGSSSGAKGVAKSPAPAGSGGVTPVADPLEGWDKIRDEDGIIVHRKEVDGSPLVAFRGEGVIDAPIARVAVVQMDLAHTPEWIERMKEARPLELIADNKFITYSHIGAPPLVSDRDFVNEVNVEYAPPSKIVYRIHGVEHPQAPKSGYVRGQLLHSSFEFTAVEPNKTRVICEIHADPKGSLPKSVVNLFQKGWAFKTISKMREQVKRPDVVDRAPQIKELLARNGFPQ